MTEPTPNQALTASDCGMLRKGDLLRRIDDGLLFAFFTSTHGARLSCTGVGEDNPVLSTGGPCQIWTFIGRPGPNGWMPWSGGDNPVPGQMVDYRWIGWALDDELSPPSLQEGGGALADQIDWSDIIAFRLASPATAAAEPNGYAANEIGALIRRREAEFEARLADLTIPPDVSSLDELDRSIMGALTDCPALSIDKQSNFVARALWPAMNATAAAGGEVEDETAVKDLRHCIAIASRSQPGWRGVWESSLAALSAPPKPPEAEVLAGAVGRYVRLAKTPFIEDGLGADLFVRFHSYLADYVLSGDGADYEPNDFERALIEDFFGGLMDDEHLFGPIRAILAALSQSAREGES